MYLERLNIFADDNKYYSYGGAFYNCDYVNMMPNCTEYCLLRTFEAMETDAPVQLFNGRSALGYPKAKDWLKDTILPTGTELKDGCVAVFDGNYGHVAFVERKIDETHAIITESQYDDNKQGYDYWKTQKNNKYWRKRTVELKVGKATLSGVGELIGFIYPEIKDIRTTRQNKPQIEILEEYVNVRTSANGDIKNVGAYCPMGIYDVLNTKEVDGWVWYKIDSKSWVREGEWLKYYPEENSLKEENEQLKADMKKIEEIVRKWV